ncbi:hypothetical protein [Paracoccus aerius]|uniref:Uncharacterized protein n=1 Tax=Paracoccus aerius TaxID=1915382 RepID=A0ABS1S8Z6_9RHOB|nr:hypothetical protein [Paracoccus aerius]MBL3673976.1 hypothetical protein [Paracoccus aerius]
MSIKAVATLLALAPLAAHAEGPDPARSNLSRNDLVKVTLMGTGAATPDRSSREDQ